MLWVLLMLLLPLLPNSMLMMVVAAVAIQIHFNLDRLGNGCQSGLNSGNGADKLKINAMQKIKINRKQMGTP